MDFQDGWTSCPGCDLAKGQSSRAMNRLPDVLLSNCYLTLFLLGPEEIHTCRSREAALSECR